MASTSYIEPARTPCRYGEDCYRKDPRHKERFSHPGDPDHPDTVASGALSSSPAGEIVDVGADPERLEAAEEHPDVHDVAQERPVEDSELEEDPKFADLPIFDPKFADPLPRFDPKLGDLPQPRLGEKWVGDLPELSLEDKFGDLFVGLPPKLPEGLKVGSEESKKSPSCEPVTPEPEEGEEMPSRSIRASLATPMRSDGADNVRELLLDGAVTPAERVGRTATRPRCPVGAGCGAGPEHRAEFAHPGDPDHPETATTEAAAAPTAHSPAPVSAEDFSPLSDAEIDFPKQTSLQWPTWKCLRLPCAFVLLGSGGAFLMVIFANLINLREDQQLLEKTWDGERVTDGPATFISWPHRRAEWPAIREVERLSPLEYAVVKNRRTQVVRHERGPGLLMMRAYEDLEDILPVKNLTFTQYHRLVDTLTGDERIVRGPGSYAPGPLERIVQKECWAERPLVAWQGEGLAEDFDVARQENCKLKCSRLEGCESFTYCDDGHSQSCHYKARWVSVGDATATTLGPMSSTTTTSATTAAATGGEVNATGNDSEVNGSGNGTTTVTTTSTSTSTSSSTTTFNREIAYCRTVYKRQCEEIDPPEEAVMINAFQAMIVENKSSGVWRLASTPGLLAPEPYEVFVQWRDAILVDELSYALVKHELNGTVAVRSGPVLLMLEAYESLESLRRKVVVRRGEFLRLVDRREGTERVVVGPAAVAPAMEEEAVEGVQQAVMVDQRTSVVMLDKQTGQQVLEMSEGIKTPQPYESILEIRPKVLVLDHQAVVTRAPDGGLTAQFSSFFLPPFHEIFSMNWSSYADLVEPAPKLGVSVLDLRTQRLPWRYMALTSDNVRLQLAGSTYWRIGDVMRMVTTTPDAPSDVLQRSKARLLSTVARVKYKDFMASMATVMDETSQQQAADSFYSTRGLAVSRVEILGYEALDDAVVGSLRSTVVEVTQQVNRMIQTQTVIDVDAAKMIGDLRLETLRTELIRHSATNTLLLAISEGVAEGHRMAEEAKTFLDGLGDSINETQSRLDLYRQYHESDALNNMTKLFSDGPASFYLHANETDLVLAGLRSEL